MPGNRVMILGMSPMPFENVRKVYGTGIRTWQFTRPLLEKGHDLCVAGYAIPSAYPDDFKSTSIKDFSHGKYRFEYHILAEKDFRDTDILTGIARDFKPDCLVGCTFYPSFYGSKIKSGLASAYNTCRTPPLWADLFGHVMAEAQARAFIDGDDSPLFHYWNSEYNIISTADIFSCVSKRQEYATIGELGAAGRLNRFTAGYEFTNTIPCGLPVEDFIHKKEAIRGKNGIGKDDFVVLWSGGYNTWTDVDTLFKGLTEAMERDPSIKFVSTGGEIPEQDVKTYPRFLSMIGSGRFASRFIMKGWIPGEEVPDHYLESDTGINIDKDIYEVRLGSKNRILDWFRAGLCVLSSDVCELTEQMAAEGAGFVFRPGDPHDLAEKLLMLASDRKKTKDTGEKGRQFGLKEFNFNRTTRALQEWVEEPAAAPDYGRERKIFFEREEALKNMEKIASARKEMIGERDMKISELEGVVKAGFPYRMYNYIKIAFRKARGKQGSGL
jgi:glycosyltransferase involved in cell wall biosynthesis